MIDQLLKEPVFARVARLLLYQDVELMPKGLDFDLHLVAGELFFVYLVRLLPEFLLVALDHLLLIPQFHINLDTADVSRHLPDLFPSS